MKTDKTPKIIFTSLAFLMIGLIWPLVSMALALSECSESPKYASDIVNKHESLVGMKENSTQIDDWLAKKSKPAKEANPPVNPALMKRIDITDNDLKNLMEVVPAGSRIQLDMYRSMVGTLAPEKSVKDKESDK